ncbi:hypothetical protein [Amycolatopsis sp. NPDC003861]
MTAWRRQAGRLPGFGGVRIGDIVEIGNHADVFGAQVDDDIHDQPTSRPRR